MTIINYRMYYNDDDDNDFVVHNRRQSATRRHMAEDEAHTRRAPDSDSDSDSEDSDLVEEEGEEEDYVVHYQPQQVEEEETFEVYTGSKSRGDEDVVYDYEGDEDDELDFTGSRRPSAQVSAAQKRKIKKRGTPRQGAFDDIEELEDSSEDEDSEEDILADDEEIVYYAMPGQSLHTETIPLRVEGDKVYATEIYPDVDPDYTRQEVGLFHRKKFYKGYSEDGDIPERVGKFSAKNESELGGSLSGIKEKDEEAYSNSSEGESDDSENELRDIRIFIGDAMNAQDGDSDAADSVEEMRKYRNGGLYYLDLSKETNFFESKVNSLFHDSTNIERNRVKKVLVGFYEEALVKICNLFLPTSLTVTDIKTDFCDGIRMHVLLTQLGMNLPDLPHPNPKTYKEKVANNSVFSTVFRGDSLKLEEGSLKFIMYVLTCVFNHFFIADMTFNNTKGWTALHDFFTNYNIGLNQPQFFKSMIDHPDNLKEVIKREFPHLSKDMNLSGDSDSEEFEVLDEGDSDDEHSPPGSLVPPQEAPQRTQSEEAKVMEELAREEEAILGEELQECMKFFEVNFGVPALLHPDFSVLTADDREWYAPYLFIECMYAALIYEMALRTEESINDVKVAIRRPKEHINNMLRKYHEMEKYSTELQDLSCEYYKSLQDHIALLNKNLIMVSRDSATNRDILHKTRSLVSACMSRKMAMFPKITQLTAKLQTLAHIWNQETLVVVDKKHSLPNLDRCFNTVLELQRKILRKVGSADTLKLRGYQREFDSKIGLLRYWLQRWDNATSDIKASRYDATALAMRRKLLAKFDKEAKNMDSELEKADLLCDTLINEELISQEDKCLNEDRLHEVATFFNKLVSDVEDAKSQLLQYETEAREIDSLQLEKATIMQKVATQLREFYQFFSTRPAIKSEREYTVTSKRVQKALEKLSEVALEIDAVLSISQILAALPGPIPVNHYTSFTDEHMTEHWEMTLARAAGMNAWMNEQKKVAEVLDKQFASKLEDELLLLATDMKDQLAAISKETTNHTMDENRLSNIKSKVELAVTRLMKNREQKIHEIFTLARPLHENGIMTPRILDMMECWDNCMLTLQILLDDVQQLLRLLNSGNRSLDQSLWADKSVIISEISNYFTELSSRVIRPRSHVKMKEDEKLILTSDTKRKPGDVLLVMDIPPDLLKFSDMVDPYGRLGCSMWLGMLQESRGNRATSGSLIQRKQEHLETQFSILADDKPFITEECLKSIFTSREELLSFALRHSSEFFGWETQDLAKEGIKCYDYKRLVCRLLGLRRRLSVNPN